MCTSNHWFQTSGTELIGPGFSSSNALSKNVRSAIQEFARGPGSDLVKGWFDEDLQLQKQHFSERIEADRERARRKEIKEAETSNVYREMTLFTTVVDVNKFVDNRSQHGNNEVISVLKRQIQSRTKFHKLDYTASKEDIDTRVSAKPGMKTIDHILYLEENLIKMIEYDIAEKRNLDSVLSSTLSLSASSATEIPTVRGIFPNPRNLTLSAMKDNADIAQRMNDARPGDDKHLLELEHEFLHKRLYDEHYDEVYQVIAIRCRWVNSKTIWLAECRRLEHGHTETTNSKETLQDYYLDSEQNLNDVRGDIRKYVEKFGLN